MKTVLRKVNTIDYRIPRMPNFLIPDNGDETKKISIAELNEEEAIALSEAMKVYFLEHWKKRKSEKE